MARVLAIASALLSLLAASCDAAAPLEAFYAPYGNYSDLNTDMELIKRVTAARLAHGADVRFEAEENPYSIQYSVYNLLDKSYVNALISAYKANVHVQVLMHYAQLSQPYVPTYGMFKNAGLPVAPSPNTTQWNLTSAQKQSLALVGIEYGGARGLMHMKLRVYRWLDAAGSHGAAAAASTGTQQRVAVSGSMNPENAAMYNDETLLVYADQPSAAGGVSPVDTYLSFYNATLFDVHGKNNWDREAPVSLIYSRWDGQGVRDIIFRLLEQEQEAVFIFMYALRDVQDVVSNATLVASLCAKHAAGVPVVVLTDKDESDGDGSFSAGDNSRTAARIAACGIPTYKCKNEAGPYNAFHHKNAMFGLSHPTVITGTANWGADSLGSGQVDGKGSHRLYMPSNVETSSILNTTALDGGVTGRRFLSNVFADLRAYSYQQACPYTFNGSSVRDNCASEEPFKQPDWNMPSSAQVAASLAASRAWPAVGVTLQLTGVPAGTMAVNVSLHGSVNRTASLNRTAAAGVWATPSMPLPFGAEVTVTFSADHAAPAARTSTSSQSLIVDVAFDWRAKARRSASVVRSMAVTESFEFGG